MLLCSEKKYSSLMEVDLTICSLHPKTSNLPWEIQNSRTLESVLPDPPPDSRTSIQPVFLPPCSTSFHSEKTWKCVCATGNFPQGLQPSASCQRAPYPTATALDLLPPDCQPLPVLAGVPAFHPSEPQETTPISLLLGPLLRRKSTIIKREMSKKIMSCPTSCVCLRRLESTLRGTHWGSQRARGWASSRESVPSLDPRLLATTHQSQA